MSQFIVKKGEVICVASGVFEGYDRAGPFIATQDFDLYAIVESVKSTVVEPWEISGLMWDIPRLLLDQGLIEKMPCRKIYLGSFDEFELREEQDDLT